MRSVRHTLALIVLSSSPLVGEGLGGGAMTDIDAFQDRTTSISDLSLLVGADKEGSAA